MYVIKFTGGPRAVEPSCLVTSGLKLYTLVNWAELSPRGKTYRSFMRRLPKAGGSWTFTGQLDGRRCSFIISRPRKI